MRGGSAADRFWSKVAEVGDCWVWIGATSRGGYGCFYVGNVDGKKLRVPAHRWAYEALRDSIPPGLQLDHLCRTRSCVNPWHLDPVPHAVNVARGERPNRTHCPQGHPYSPANTYRAARGDRQCRVCTRERNRQYAKARRARPNPNPAEREAIK